MKTLAEQPTETIETTEGAGTVETQADDAKPVVAVIETLAAVSVTASGNNPHGSGL